MVMSINAKELCLYDGLAACIRASLDPVLLCFCADLLSAACLANEDQ